MSMQQTEILKSRVELERRTCIVEWGLWSKQGVKTLWYPSMNLLAVPESRQLAPITDEMALKVDALVTQLPPRTRELIEMLYKDCKPLMIAAPRLRMARETARELRLQGLQFILEGLIKNARGSVDRLPLV